MVPSKGLPDRLSSKNGAENGFMAVSKVASAQDGEALVEVMSATTRNEKENAVALPPKGKEIKIQPSPEVLHITPRMKRRPEGVHRFRHA